MNTACGIQDMKSFADYLYIPGSNVVEIAEI